MRLRLLLSRTDSCCMLVNAFLMLEFYATKASGALCPRHFKTICHVFQYIFSKPVVTWRMMWVFSRTDIKHIQQFPCLRVASRQKWRASLKTLLKSEKHVYIEQNAWQWTRSFNRVKAIFGFFRQASAPWHVPRRSTQTTIANRNRCLQVFQYLKAWNQASEVH